MNHRQLTMTGRKALFCTLIACGVTQGQERETLEISGLQAPVQILVDRWGISHIYAENQADLFFAQGFNVARDRLFQLELWRRRATGTVAEILGPRALQQDIGARLLKARLNMDEELSHYHPDGVEIVSSFVRGINAYIDLTRTVPELLPLEFHALGLKPEHWTWEVVISRHNGLFRNVNSELSAARRVAAIGVEDTIRLTNFDPPRPDLAIPAGLDLSLLSNQITRRYSAGRSSIRFNRGDVLPEFRAVDDEPPAPLPPDLHLDPRTAADLGSNNWVVSGSKTFTRMPFMANDPHRSQQIPSLRYWVHLNAPGWNVIGGGEPSLPGISIGHNDHGAWGLTIFSVDQEDLYVYDTDPDDPNRYRYQDGWEEMRVTRESIAIKGEDPVEAEFKYTRHGPVLFEDPDNNKAYALRAAWLEVGGAPYLASLRMDQARSWEEFREACTYSHTPSENMVWADVDGNIGWQAVGITPIRKNWYGILPVPGDGRYEWDGFLPIRQLPNAFNPDQGFVATANENNLPLDYPHRLGYSWSDPSRSMRIQEVLGSGRKFTMLDMMNLQQDELALPARTLVGLLDNHTARSDAGAAALDLLSEWDHVMDISSVAATIFTEWQRRLSAQVRAIYAPMTIRAAAPGPSQQRVMAMLIAPDGRFGADPLVARDEMLVDALEEAVAALSQRLGGDMKGWQYGQRAVHFIQMRHVLNGLLKPELSAGFDLGPLPRGGSGSTVNSTGGGNQRSGASFRMIADTSNWDNSVGTNNPGQSGNPTSPHYDDLFEMWATGRYFPVLFSRTSVESATEQVTVLQPAK